MCIRDRATGAQALAQNLGNQTVFVTRHGSSEQQLELLQQLRAEEESGNVTGITGYYALLDNIASGLSIPIADIEENGGGELMTLQFTTEELISFIEGEIPQSVTDRVQAAITQKAQTLLTSDVAARILVESIGGSFDEARRNEITQQVVAEYTAKYIESIGAQMSEYMGALGALKMCIRDRLNALYLPTGGKVVVCGRDTSDQELSRIHIVGFSISIITANPPQ